MAPNKALQPTPLRGPAELQRYARSFSTNVPEPTNSFFLHF